MSVENTKINDCFANEEEYQEYLASLPQGKEVKSAGCTLNLHNNISSWRVYRTNVSPIAGNECGYLAPQKYNGLSYKADTASYTSIIFQITTEAFGRVQIVAPYDEDSCKAEYKCPYGFSPH